MVPHKRVSEVREVYVIGDIHGCFNTLQELLNTITKEGATKENVAFVGDYIDRGPKSKQVLDLVMKDYQYCCKGNHEDMAECYLTSKDIDLSLYTLESWAMNGGFAALVSLDISTEKIKSTRTGSELTNKYGLQPYVDFIKSLPYYLIFEDCEKDNKKLVVSHTVIPFKQIDLPDLLRRNPTISSLWHRDATERYGKIIGHYNVHGHSIVDEINVTENWSNIDTGCISAREGITRYLSCLRYPDMKVFKQKNIDVT